MVLKLYSVDEIILQAIKEKHSFESHKDDISYADHHKKVWMLCDVERPARNDKTVTLSQLKRIVDKQLKVK